MTSAYDELIYRWPSKIGAHKRSVRPRRPFAAMGYLVNGGLTETFIEADRLLLVLLFDESIGRRAPALRLVGYGNSPCEHGHFCWGGSANAKFYKDFSIEPAAGASGLQLNASKTDLFQLSLQLHSDLHRADRYAPKSARPFPELPRLWAGFPKSDAAELVGEGPEFEQLCQKFHLAPAVILHTFERCVHGLHLFPLDWIGPLHKSVATFVDLEGFPKRQVFRLDDFPSGLLGFEVASMWDFHRSPMRDRYGERLRARAKIAAAASAEICSVA